MANFCYPVVLLLTSFAVLAIGLMFKVLHWPGGWLITGSMFMVQAISIVWLIILLVRPSKKP
ncbi:hypothetical protein [Mucilaginibacter sp. BT774]|uniref:hypothetical protein n=1 Tax=Mucilaginibacter sp. BT774 TaxID=3062276 RepID=UPI00267745DE|nr:hypothetical protein [Mucilaginibacter sp. BT774]MDO3625699.1 hypothetical protein [Mucilaginibacter sp. BT774]